MMNRGLAETVVPSEQNLARLILDLQMLKSMVSDQQELMTVGTPEFRHSSRKEDILAHASCLSARLLSAIAREALSW